MQKLSCPNCGSEQITCVQKSAFKGKKIVICILLFMCAIFPGIIYLIYTTTKKDNWNRCMQCGRERKLDPLDAMTPEERKKYLKQKRREKILKIILIIVFVFGMIMALSN